MQNIRGGVKLDYGRLKLHGSKGVYFWGFKHERCMDLETVHCFKWFQCSSRHDRGAMLNTDQVKSFRINKGLLKKNKGVHRTL